MKPAARRFHIIGGPGSGKTTLARQIAAITGAPVYGLDAVAFENGAGPERAPDARLADAACITAQAAWVSEGVYLGWTETFFAAAERILWLDMPWRVARGRIVRRHVLAELRGSNPHSGWRKLALFLRWCRGYYANSSASLNRDLTAQALAPYAAKCTRLADPRAVQDALQAIRAAETGGPACVDR